MTLRNSFSRNFKGTQIKIFKILNLDAISGLVACLFWNFIATTTAWIKGEGTLERVRRLCFIHKSLYIHTFIYCMIACTNNFYIHLYTV